MKVIEFYPTNNYSCELCQKEFVSVVDLQYWIFCCELCRQKLMFLFATKLFPNAKKESLSKLALKFTGWSHGNS